MNHAHPIVIALVLLGTTQANAQTRTWIDTEFTAWTCTPLFVVNASTVSCRQESAGGNPGAYYRIQNDVSNQGAIIGGHLSSDPMARFDPGTEGPFGRLEVAFDAEVTQANSFGGVVAFTIELEQGGHLYNAACTYDLVFLGDGWVRLSAEMSASQFTAWQVASPAHPDLSGGAPFTVGFETSNSTCCGGGFSVSSIDNFEVTAMAGGGDVGSPYCGPAAMNSSGRAGDISADGSDVAGGGPLRLRASCLPDDVFGYFIGSTTTGMVPNAGGGPGTLCLGGSIGRFNAQVQNSGHGGWLAIDVDTLAVPGPTGAVVIQAGETWNFQCWHRDTGSTSNFTSAIAITFQ